MEKRSKTTVPIGAVRKTIRVAGYSMAGIGLTVMLATRIVNAVMGSRQDVLLYPDRGYFLNIGYLWDGVAAHFIYSGLLLMFFGFLIVLASLRSDE